MSKHLKMIVSYKSGPRIEDALESGNSYGKFGSEFAVYSALYGDGSGKYEDVTKTIQGWATGEWPENWEDVLYAERKPRLIGGRHEQGQVPTTERDSVVCDVGNIPLLPAASVQVLDAPTGGDISKSSSLVIQHAYYGIKDTSEHIDVSERLVSLIVNDSLDIIVNNSTLCPGQNPYRGKKKTLTVFYYYGNGPLQTIERDEKDWLIIGQAQREIGSKETAELVANRDGRAEDARPDTLRHLTSYSGNRVVDAVVDLNPPRTPTALNDYLIRKFSISPQRLRGPMPIELRDFHRNDLAVLFAELGFKRGCEVGVAEANFSEVMLKANPGCHLLLVDPWHAYSGNPQNKSVEKNEYAYNETVRKTKDYPNVKLDMRLSMDAVRDVADNSLDFCYLDGHHSYPFVMADIIEWSKKVRSGGIVAGDDIYRLNEKWGAGPMEAIYDYTRAMQINPWFLINAHKSVDFFFVKP